METITIKTGLRVTHVKYGNGYICDRSVQGKTGVKFDTITEPIYFTFASMVLKPEVRKRVKALETEPANDIIKRAGVVTTENLTQTWWTYEGKKIGRPIVNKWEQVMLEEFGIKIVYVKELNDGE